MSAPQDRKWGDGDEWRWSRLIFWETVVIAVLLVLLVCIVFVGIYFERARVFTNAGLIVVFAALLAEFTRRIRHFAQDERLNAPRANIGPDRAIR